MKQRLNYREAARECAKALDGLNDCVRASGLEPRLVELVKTRVSQLNASAYCVDVHTRAARELGEGERRLYALAAWSGAPFFTDRERAALAWAEAVTKVAESGVPDWVFEQAWEHFNDRQLAALTMAIVHINATNRLAVAFRMAPEARKEDSRRHGAAAGRSLS